MEDGIDRAAQYAKIAGFLSVTGFSTLISFTVDSDEAHWTLPLFSGLAFTASAVYSIAKNIGVWRDVKKQIDLNQELREQLDTLPNVGIEAPPTAEDDMHIPKTFWSEKTFGFNHYTNSMVAFLSSMLTWCSSYSLFGKKSAPWFGLGSAMAFALTHIITAHYLRKQMALLNIEYTALVEQLKATINISEDRYDQARDHLRNARAHSDFLREVLVDENALACHLSDDLFHAQLDNRRLKVDLRLADDEIDRMHRALDRAEFKIYDLQDLLTESAHENQRLRHRLNDELIRLDTIIDAFYGNDQPRHSAPNP